ncbi:hypothetical protein EON81_16130 [bacterium]|nr:MAG: hypothetical protein EON81_16130 [bacterium]
MPSTVSNVHYNKPLTGVVVRFQPQELKAFEIMKRFPVASESDVFTVMDRDNYVAPETFRADRTESNPTSIGWRWDSYSCNEHALHDFITKRERDNTNNEFDLEAIKAENVKRQVLNRLEITVYGKDGILRTPGNNGGSSNETLANVDTASYRTVIQKAIDAVELNCDMPANTIALATDVLRHITRTKEWKDDARYTTNLTDGDGLPTEILGLRVVRLPIALSTGKKGQSKKPTERLMGDDIWVGHVAEGESIGNYTVSYGGVLIANEYSDMWWDKDTRSDKIEYGLIYDPKVIAKECGYLIQSVLDR